MKKNKKAFTLIEIVIATGILTIAIFGVYKLIGENSKLINNSNNYLQLNNLFINMQECLKNQKNNIVIKNNGDNFGINFGNDLKGCNLSTTDNSVFINNINYYLDGKIINKQDNFIDLELIIQGDGIGKQIKNFRINL